MLVSNIIIFQMIVLTNNLGLLVYLYRGQMGQEDNNNN